MVKAHSKNSNYSFPRDGEDWIWKIPFVIFFFTFSQKHLNYMQNEGYFQCL